MADAVKKGSVALTDAVSDSVAVTASVMFDADTEAVAVERSETEAVAVDMMVAVSVTDAATAIRLDKTLECQEGITYWHRTHPPLLSL